MIDEIFDLICQEARKRGGPDLETTIMVVLIEVIEKVCDSIKPVRLEDIKSIRLKFKKRE